MFDTGYSKHLDELDKLRTTVAPKKARGSGQATAQTSATPSHSQGRKRKAPTNERLSTGRERSSKHRSSESEEDEGVSSEDSVDGTMEVDPQDEGESYSANVHDASSSSTTSLRRSSRTTARVDYSTLCSVGD